MQSDHQTHHTLVVRLWSEKNGQGNPIWRGSVDDVLNGKRCYFQGMERLNETILKLMERDSLEEGDIGGRENENGPVL